MLYWTFVSSTLSKDWERESTKKLRRSFWKQCIQHESGEIDPISRMVIVCSSSYWYLSCFCVILKHGLVLTWNMACDKKVIQNFTFSLNSLLHFKAWSLHCKLEFTKILEKLLCRQAQQPNCSNLRTSAISFYKWSTQSR